MLSKHVRKKLQFEQLISYWYAVHSVMCTEDVDDALSEYPKSFITSWYIMRLILLSAYLIHKLKICYVCKRTCQPKLNKHWTLTFYEQWKYGKFGLNLDVTSFGYLDSKMRLRLGQIPSQYCFTLCETCQNRLQFCSINSYCREHGLKYKKVISSVPKEFIVNSAIYQDGTVGRKFSPIKVLNGIEQTLHEDSRFLTQFMR